MYFLQTQIMNLLQIQISVFRYAQLYCKIMQKFISLPLVEQSCFQVHVQEI